eukprot:SAG31_NODE_7812_length_1590_cov_169.191818_2_plen_138_part_00
MQPFHFSEFTTGASERAPLSLQNSIRGKLGGKKSGKKQFQNKKGTYATKDGVENAGCVKGGKKSHGSCTGIGKGGRPGPRTTKEQTQANFEVFQRNHPDQLPEIARVEGFHYLKLRRIGFLFKNASGKTKARVTRLK